MPVLELYGQIVSGKLEIYNRAEMAQGVKEFPDCDVQITIKKRGKRSLPANKYYWGCIIPEIRNNFKERGIRMSVQDIHEFLKLHFNKQYLLGEGGEMLGEYAGATSEMNQDEFSFYIESIKEWCSEKLGLYIPEPSKQTILSL